MTDYRDVTPSSSSSRDHLKSMAQVIFAFLKNPLEGIKRLPDWSWSSLIACVIVLSMMSGVLSGLIPPNFYRLVGGFILSPLVGLTSAFVGSLLVYYYFQVFEKRTCSLRKIFTLILFSTVPFFAFQIASEILPPVTLVGFAFAAMLLAVGLTENFHLEKKRSVRLASVLFGVIFLLWLWNRVDISQMS